MDTQQLTTLYSPHALPLSPLPYPPLASGSPLDPAIDSPYLAVDAACLVSTAASPVVPSFADAPCLVSARNFDCVPQLVSPLIVSVACPTTPSLDGDQRILSSGVRAPQPAQQNIQHSSASASESTEHNIMHHCAIRLCIPLYSMCWEILFIFPPIPPRVVNRALALWPGLL